MQVTFRPLQEEDLKWFNKVRNSCRSFLHDDRKFSLKETREWFKTLPEKSKYYIIQIIEPPCTVFGNIKVKDVGYFRTNHFNEEIIDIGMDLDQKYRGKHLAKQVYRAFLNRLFIEKDYKIAMLEVLATNHRAYCLYRSLGFEVITGADFKDIIRDGHPVLSIPMGLLASTWLGG